MKRKGFLGEDMAADYLRKMGYRILERNFRFKRKEVDIIALNEEILVFIEVKNWDYYAEENIEYGINYEKQRRIIQVAKYFLTVNNEYGGHLVRFDYIFITGDGCKFEHIKNAFSEV